MVLLPCFAGTANHHGGTCALPWGQGGPRLAIHSNHEPAVSLSFHDRPAATLPAQPANGGSRRLSFGLLALVGSAGAGLVMCMIVSLILILHARNAVQQETDSAFLMASATATMTLPTAFGGEDMLARAVQLAEEINSLRHVSAWVDDAAGGRLTPENLGPPGSAAPGWLVDRLMPEPRSDIFPIRQYPNLLGIFHLTTDPMDEIAKTWENLRIILPLLAAAVVAMIAVSMGFMAIVQRRLRAVGQAMERMREQGFLHPVPDSGIVEIATLSEGVNALAVHLEQERAENRRLHGRIMTLTQSERSQIASDLHDEVGPQLFALRAAIGQAAAVAGGLPPDRRGSLQEALDAIGRHALAMQGSTRRAIENLRPVGMEHGSLGEMAQELILEFSEISADTRISADIDPGAEAGGAAEISLYRFLRESVLNAIRHGQPRNVRIVVENLTGSGQGIRARVLDDGSGPLPSSLPGLGQSGIQDRALAIGAAYTPPHHKDGWTVTELRIPK